MVEEFNGLMEDTSGVEFASVNTNSIGDFLSELELPAPTATSAPFWLQLNSEQRQMILMSTVY